MRLPSIRRSHCLLWHTTHTGGPLHNLTSVVLVCSDKYYVQYTRGSLSRVASDIVGFYRRE